jgi:hypothetical protein
MNQNRPPYKYTRHTSKMPISKKPIRYMGWPCNSYGLSLGHPTNYYEIFLAPSVNYYVLVKGRHAVTQYTTACCSVQVIDITLAKYRFTNITSLRVV